MFAQCTYCGFKVAYGESRPRSEAIEELTSHEQSCDENPMVAALHRTKYLLDQTTKRLQSGLDVLASIQLDCFGRVLTAPKPARSLLRRRPLPSAMTRRPKQQPQHWVFPIMSRREYHSLRRWGD